MVRSDSEQVTDTVVNNKHGRVAQTFHSQRKQLQNIIFEEATLEEGSNNKQLKY